MKITKKCGFYILNRKPTAASKGRREAILITGFIGSLFGA
jgi:hypothetical protein